MNLKHNFSIFNNEDNEKSVKDAIQNFLQTSRQLPEMEIVIGEFEIYVSTDSDDLHAALEPLSDYFLMKQENSFPIN